MTSELNGKRVAILAADGVERVELEQPRQALAEAGAHTELLSLHDEEPAPQVAMVDVKARRWWPVALGAAIVAGAILVTGHDGGPNAAAAPPAPSTSSTLFTPVPDSQNARADLEQRRSYATALISADASSLIVLSQRGGFELDLTEPRGDDQEEPPRARER